MRVINRRPDARGWTLNSMILCDDVRQEVSGKETLVGVYSSTIVVAAIPASLKSLFFRISVTISDATMNQVRFSVTGPDGNKVSELSGSPPPFKSNGEASLVFEHSPMNLPFSGRYKVELALGGGPAVEVGTFEVRLPSGSAELGKLKVQTDMNA